MSTHPLTDVIRTRVDRTNEMEHSSPLFLTSSFCFDNAEEMRAAFADETDDNIYSRFSNPNVKEFTDRMCALEGAEARFCHGFRHERRIRILHGFFKKGDHLLSCNAIFGSTHTVITKYLPKYGIEYSYVPASGSRRMGSRHPAQYKNDLSRNTHQSGAGNHRPGIGGQTGEKTQADSEC